jgi:hypothetical protein
MIHTQLKLWLTAGLAACLLSGNAVSAEARWLEVHLFDNQSGQPLQGAAVCLGTNARVDQFGAQRTDRNGVVRFNDVRPYEIVLTASRQGYQGRQQLLEPVYESRVLIVKLVTGGGGAECAAPVAETQPASGLLITTIQVRRDPVATTAGGVLVSARLNGDANQIRISEQADFTGASWQPYSATVPYSMSAAAGLKTLFVQVRRVSQLQGAEIEVASPVSKVNYRSN